MLINIKKHQQKLHQAPNKNKIILIIHTIQTILSSH